MTAIAIALAFLILTTSISSAAILLAVRQLRRDRAGNLESAIIDLHMEMRGRLAVIESIVSREPINQRALVSTAVEDDRIETSAGRANWSVN